MCKVVARLSQAIDLSVSEREKDGREQATGSKRMCVGVIKEIPFAGFSGFFLILFQAGWWANEDHWSGQV